MVWGRGPSGLESESCEVEGRAATTETVRVRAGGADPTGLPRSRKEGPFFLFWLKENQVFTFLSEMLLT